MYQASLAVPRTSRVSFSDYSEIFDSPFRQGLLQHRDLYATACRSVLSDGRDEARRRGMHELQEHWIPFHDFQDGIGGRRISPYMAYASGGSHLAHGALTMSSARTEQG